MELLSACVRAVFLTRPFVHILLRIQHLPNDVSSEYFTACRFPEEAIETMCKLTESASRNSPTPPKP